MKIYLDAYTTEEVDMLTWFICEYPVIAGVTFWIWYPLGLLLFILIYLPYKLIKGELRDI